MNTPVIKERRQITYVIDQYVIEHRETTVDVERHYKPDGTVVYEISDKIGPWVKGTEMHDEIKAFLEGLDKE